MMLGGICFPIGFFLLGWAPLAGKIVGLVFVGLAFLLIFQYVSLSSLTPFCNE
jgi:hypothetical protein